MKISKLLAATALAGVFAAQSHTATAQPNPELVDLPAYLAYVAQHPTRFFTIGITSPVKGEIVGALVSPALAGGTFVYGNLQKNQLDATGVATLQRDPRKMSAFDDMQVGAVLIYGNEFTSGAGYDRGTVDAAVFQAKVGQFGGRLDTDDDPGTENRLWPAVARLSATAKPSSPRKNWRRAITIT